MDKRILEASAPGTLFLMGEHAVLKGHKAITSAVDQRLTVRLETRFDNKVMIHSVLGEYESDIQTLAQDDRFGFILSAIRQFQAKITIGFELTVASAFSHQVGLGSSAAVTVATCGLFHQWLNGELPQNGVFHSALKVMRDVQGGKGSGADLAACVVGGVVAYQVEPVVIEPLNGVPEIQLYFSGYKMKTPDVIAKVDSLTRRQPELYQHLYALMGQVTEQAIHAVNEENWVLFGQLMNLYQGLMDALGVNDHTLSVMIYRLREQGALGAKITGSGLGDCVYALQTSKSFVDIGYECLPVRLSAKGLDVEMIQ